MEETKNTKAAYKLCTKRNRLLIICAILSPFVIIFLDSIFLENKSIFAEYIGTYAKGSLCRLILLWVVYLMTPCFLMIGLMNTVSKAKLILFLAAVLLLFPLSWMVFFYVGMGLYNVYP